MQTVHPEIQEDTQRTMQEPQPPQPEPVNTAISRLNRQNLIKLELCFANPSAFKNDNGLQTFAV